MRLEWDKTGERLYETGVKNGVLFPKTGANGAYAKGVAWNGLTKVSDKPEGAEITTIYADDIEYLNLVSREKFNGSISAYMYPDEFAVCDGSAMVGAVKLHQQSRRPFGLSYVTTIGNDEEGTDFGYIIHLVWNATASPSEVEHDTINDSPEAKELSWEFKTTAVNVAGHKPTSHIEVYSKIKNSSGVYVDVDLSVLEAALYGVDEFSATAAYAKDALVVHTESTVTKLYKAKAAVAAGAWDATKWDEVVGYTGNGDSYLPTPDEVLNMSLQAPAG